MWPQVFDIREESCSLQGIRYGSFQPSQPLNPISSGGAHTDPASPPDPSQSVETQSVFIKRELPCPRTLRTPRLPQRSHHPLSPLPKRNPSLIPSQMPITRSPRHPLTQRHTPLLPPSQEPPPRSPQRSIPQRPSGHQALQQAKEDEQRDAALAVAKSSHGLIA